MTAEHAQVLVVTAHPDDAEYGVAGTVVHWVREGKNVVYVVCSNGEKGTSDRKMKPEELVRIREKEQLAAAKLLDEAILQSELECMVDDTPILTDAHSPVQRRHVASLVLRRVLGHQADRNVW